MGKSLLHEQLVFPADPSTSLRLAPREMLYHRLQSAEGWFIRMTLKWQMQVTGVQEGARQDGQQKDLRYHVVCGLLRVEGSSWEAGR